MFIVSKVSRCAVFLHPALKRSAPELPTRSGLRSDRLWKSIQCTCARLASYTTSKQMDVAALSNVRRSVASGFVAQHHL